MKRNKLYCFLFNFRPKRFILILKKNYCYEITCRIHTQVHIMKKMNYWRLTDKWVKFTNRTVRSLLGQCSHIAEAFFSSLMETEKLVCDMTCFQCKGGGSLGFLWDFSRALCFDHLSVSLFFFLYWEHPAYHTLTFEKISTFPHTRKHILLEIGGTMNFWYFFVRTVILQEKIAWLKPVLITVGSTGVITELLKVWQESVQIWHSWHHLKAIPSQYLCVSVYLAS